MIYRNLIEAAGYKTGIYTRASWWDSRVTTAQSVDFGKRPLWAAQYNTTLTMIPKGWTSAMIWQHRTPAIGIEAGVSSKEIDYNIWNSDEDFNAEWGVASVAIQDGYQKFTRFASDVYLWRGALLGKVLATNTNHVRQRVSSVAYDSLVAINGDGWDGTNTPLSYAASEGNLYQPVQYDARPYINIDRLNKITIAHVPPTAPYNMVSGTRYLIKDGKNFFATSTDPEHITELHPRTAAGYTVDGKLILCVVDGRSGDSAGITLRDLATVMIDAGAFMALELDGGGSSAMCINGAVVNVPSDGAERPVINHLIVYEESNTMSQYTASAIGDNTKFRIDHNTNNTAISSHPANTKFHGDVLFIAPLQLKNSAGVVYQEVGDKWLQVTDINGVATNGWVAITHMKTQQICALTDNGTTTPPVETLPDLKLTIDAGVKYPVTTVIIKPL
jgi:hypothetical protein